jgi:hypothetical protein
MLRETNWVIGGKRGAAAQLGLPRTTLIAMMQRHKIARETSELHKRRWNQTIPTSPTSSQHRSNIAHMADTFFDEPLSQIAI